MSWFKSLVISICAAGVCFGALFIICPEGKMSKSVKYVFSLCFLLIIIACVGVNIKKADINLNFEAQSSEPNIESQVALAEYTYGLVLKNSGIDFTYIKVFTDNSFEDGIRISKVLIKSKVSREKILLAFGKAAENFEVEVINE